MNISSTEITLIGVGPGDPSLITLAAIEAISQATVVAYPIPSYYTESLAAQIASKWITKDKKRLPLLFPMVDNVSQRKDAWLEASKNLVREVLNGQKVVFLCQGDASLFSSSSYLLLEITKKYPECNIKVIPGINSFSAAAALGKLPLALQDEQLLIIPTPSNPEKLEEVIQEAIANSRIIVLLKLGRKWPWVRELLERNNLLDCSLFIQKIGFSDQKILLANKVNDLEKKYFSLLIIRQSWPSILP